MAFNHGKAAQFAIRDIGGVWRDMTSYTQEVALPNKAGVAETTVFGRGAKSYIGGILEGQMTVKGFYDPSSNAVDAVMSGLLGSQPTTGLTVVAAVTAQSNYGQFLLAPAGAATGVVKLGDCVLTDYTVSVPVTGVVAFSATFNISGGTAIVAATTTNNGGTVTGTQGTNIWTVPYSIAFNSAYTTTPTTGAANFAALIGSSK